MFVLKGIMFSLPLFLIDLYDRYHNLLELYRPLFQL
jgi:hypothetical protein